MLIGIKARQYRSTLILIDPFRPLALLLPQKILEVSMEAEISSLERRIETLIDECRRLSTENRSLRTEHHDLLSEKTQLKEKNRLACSRLERIVEKLKLLEEQ